MGPAGRGKRMPKAIKDATGQLIIDQDEENMSDKEMYARNVPAIGKMEMKGNRQSGLDSISFLCCRDNAGVPERVRPV